MNDTHTSPRTGPGHSRRLAVAASAALATVLGAAGLAQADFAENVPSNALFALKVNGMQKVADDFSALATEWGLDQLEPAFGDPIASFKQDSGMAEGVDFDGEFGFYAPATATFDGDEPPLVFLVPVSDYQAFLGNFGEATKEGELDVVQHEGETLYVKEQGDYAAIAILGDLLGGDMGEMGLELNGPTEGEMSDEDVTFYANFVALSPVITGAIEEEGGREKLMEGIAELFEEEDVPQGLVPYRPVVEAAAGQGYAVVESFLRDADAATISLDFDPETGVAAGIVAQFKDDSYLAETFGSLETAEGSLLSGLPQGDYLVYGGSVGNTEASLKLFNDLVGPIEEPLGAVESDSASLLQQAVEAGRTAIGATESARFGLFAPAVDNPGESPLIQQVQIATGDADALYNVTEENAQLGPKLMSAFATEAGEEAPPITSTFEADAKEVAGVSFARAKTELPQGDMMQTMITNTVFGPEGQTAYVAVVDDEHFVQVGGLTDEQIATVVEAVRAGDSPLSDKPGMDAMAGALPENQSAVLFWDVAETARAGLGVLQAFNQAPPIQIPLGLPPVGVAVGPDGDALRAGVLIPKDLVSAAIVTYLQAQQGMGGAPDQGL